MAEMDVRIWTELVRMQWKRRQIAAAALQEAERELSRTERDAAAAGVDPAQLEAARPPEFQTLPRLDMLET